MEDWNAIEGELDWLTGGYTYKREKLKKALTELGGVFPP